jgi:transposase-like protein
MPRKKRRSFTAEQKAAILRRHHVDKVPVSQLCEEEDLQPSVFYSWQKQAFGNLEAALQSRGRPDAKEKALVAENERLRARLTRKDHVIAVVSEEYVTLKKALGEP